MTVLPHRVTLQKLTTSDDASGGNVQAWATRTAGVVCLVTQQSARGPNGQTHTVTFPTQSTAAAEVGVGDRLLVTAGPGFTTGLYLTVDGITRHGGVGYISAFTRLSCSEVLESYQPG